MLVPERLRFHTSDNPLIETTTVVKRDTPYTVCVVSALILSVYFWPGCGVTFHIFSLYSLFAQHLMQMFCKEIVFSLYFMSIGILRINKRL